jgi:hypothetical protein
MKRSSGVTGGLLFFITLALLSSGHVFADDYTLYYVDTNRLSYTGTVSTYGTLADALNGTNATGTYSITNRPGDAPYDTPYRDAVIMIWSNGAYGYTYNNNDFYTNVYSTTPGNAYGSGTGNPNKTQEGLIMLTGYDGGPASTGDQGYFHDFNGTSYTEFTLQFTGGSANLTASRLWNAPASYTYDPNADLSQWSWWNPTLGTFLSYQFNVTFGGLAGTPESTYGGILATNNPTSVNGTFTGVFQNTNTNGYYVANLTFGMDNWAYAQNSLQSQTITSEFWGYAQPDPVPEPSVLLLFPFGLAGIVLIKKGRVGTPARKSPLPITIFNAGRYHPGKGSVNIVRGRGRA